MSKFLLVKYRVWSMFIWHLFCFFLSLLLKFLLSFLFVVISRIAHMHELKNVPTNLHISYTFYVIIDKYLEFRKRVDRWKRRNNGIPHACVTILQMWHTLDVVRFDRFKLWANSHTTISCILPHAVKMKTANYKQPATWSTISNRLELIASDSMISISDQKHWN